MHTQDEVSRGLRIGCESVVVLGIVMHGGNGLDGQDVRSDTDSVPSVTQVLFSVVFTCTDKNVWEENRVFLAWDDKWSLREHQGSLPELTGSFSGPGATPAESWDSCLAIFVFV